VAVPAAAVPGRPYSRLLKFRHDEEMGGEAGDMRLDGDIPMDRDSHALERQVRGLAMQTTPWVRNTAQRVWIRRATPVQVAQGSP